jgi:hypothetical protein
LRQDDVGSAARCLQQTTGGRLEIGQADDFLLHVTSPNKD